MKACFKCGETKPLTEFYRHKAMADGHLGKCKDCTRADATANRERNIGRYRAYDRQRYRESSKRKDQLAKLVGSAAERRLPANYALGNAVRDGRVKKAEACWHCGSTDKIEGHHVHYDMPLDVVWLCKSCHCKAHRQTTLYDRQAIKAVG